jgi:plasmid stabilization system protein ParE
VKKKLPIKWDIQAKKELDAIFYYIESEASTSIAKKVKKELIHLIGTLNNFPEKYHKEFLLESSKKNYRSVMKWNYKIIYEVTDEEIIIAYIFHSRQNPEKILRVVK